MAAASQVSVRRGPRFGHARTYALVAVAFWAMMGCSGVPTPLYALYEARDGFGATGVTLLFATYTAGVAVSLVFVGHLSDDLGRRPVLFGALLLGAVANLVMADAHGMPALFLARALNGLAVGATTSTAATYLIELWRGAGRTSRHPQLMGAAAGFSGPALGAVLAGVWADHLDAPLVVPYLLFAGVLVAVALLVAAMPETRPARKGLLPYRPQRVAVAAHARRRFAATAASCGAVSFASGAIFATVAPTFLAEELDQRSHTIAALAFLLTLSSGVAGQLLTQTLTPRTVLRIGAGTTACGLVLLLVSISLPDPQLLVFLAAGMTIGAGAGMLFRSGLAQVTAMSVGGRAAETLAGFFLAAYAGAGSATITMGVLTQHASAQVAVAAFASLALAVLALGVRALR